MKTFLLPALLLLACGTLPAADVRLEVVTPARGSRSLSEVPASLEVVIPEQLDTAPGRTLDEQLRLAVPGLDSGRSSGDVADRGAAMTMRGLGIGTQGGRGQGRTLILLDGIPLNDSATGGVRWNDLRAAEIDRVEVLKGPASSLYGSSALAGAVNIITRKPGPGFYLETSYGSYDTFGSAARAGLRSGGLSLGISGSLLESGGYVRALPEDRDSYTRKAYLRERSAGARAELDFGESGVFSSGFSRSEGTAGLGTNYRGTAGGEYRQSVTDMFSLDWKGGPGWSVSFFSQRTAQSRKEGSGPTRLTDISVDRSDYGMMSSGSAEVAGVTASFGLDWRHGGVDGYDDYNNGKYARDIGEMDSFAPFLQAQGKLLDGRLDLVAGLRYDAVRFHDGYAENTSAPGFFSGGLSEKSWGRLSPRVSAGYRYSGAVSQYASFSGGFRAGELENMVLTLVKGSGANKWYQKPNPDLGPETAYTAETGFRLNPASGFYADPSAYFTAATDFIYQVATGIVDPAYGTEKMYTNLGSVQIYGLELPVKYLSGEFSFSAAYAQSLSRVISAPGLGITGNRLTYAPRHIYSAGLAWRRGGASLHAGWSRKSRQFSDDANTEALPAYSVVNAGAEKKFGKTVSAALKAGNIFNERRQQYADELAPGRNFTFTVKAAF